MKKLTQTSVMFVRSMRPYQWIKNTFIFAPMVFSFSFFNRLYIQNSLVAFFLFSLVAGCIYVINDCFDREKDRLHPEKRKRPIAAGDLDTTTAYTGAAILLAVSLYTIYTINIYFFYITLAYIAMNIIYSSFLKRVVILDVMIIAVGFVMRVEIGGVVNNIKLFPWILIITFLLAIFLGLVKRRQELVKIMEAKDNRETRKTLKEYNISLLDQLISVTTGTTLISYISYVMDPAVQQKFNTQYLYLTVPFVIFGIFRYLYMTYSKGKGENPAEIIFTDIPFSANLVAWVTVFIMVVMLGKQ